VSPPVLWVLWRVYVSAVHCMCTTSGVARWSMHPKLPGRNPSPSLHRERSTMRTVPPIMHCRRLHWARGIWLSTMQHWCAERHVGGLSHKQHGCCELGLPRTNMAYSEGPSLATMARQCVRAVSSGMPDLHKRGAGWVRRLQCRARARWVLRVYLQCQ
jgi:hypothetical protein